MKMIDKAIGFIKALKQFLIAIIFFMLVTGLAYWGISFSSFIGYVTLPLHLEHNRYIFLILFMPFLFFFILLESGYVLIKGAQLPEKYAKSYGKYMIYGLAIVLLGITPIFSIASGYYLEHHGYERCPDNKRGALSSITTLDYAKSPEYCPQLIEKEKPKKSKRGVDLA